MNNTLEIVYRSVDELIPYAKNARTHAPEQISQIAASIKEFGWTNPVLLDGENGLIAGHGRLLAAQKLKLKQVPTIELSHLTENQKRAYIIADNKIALNSGWDEAMLRIEVIDLLDVGMDASLLGFTDMELSSVLLDREQGETDAEKEWEGMPEFEQPDIQSFRKVVVHFACQSDFDEFFRLIGQTATDKTNSIWHPKQEKNDPESRRYE